MDRDEVIEEITRANEEDVLDLLNDLVDEGILEFIGVYPIN